MLKARLQSGVDFISSGRPVAQPGCRVSRLTAEKSLSSFGALLIRREQALSLGVFQYSIVAEVVLLRRLNAEGPLRSHATHCLKHVEGAHVLELGQTDVQGAEGTCREQGQVRLAPVSDLLKLFELLHLYRSNHLKVPFHLICVVLHCCRKMPLWGNATSALPSCAINTTLYKI